MPRPRPGLPSATHPYAGRSMEATPAPSIQDAIDAFARAGLADPESEASRLLAILRAPPAEARAVDVAAVARERGRGVPLEYAVGRGTFMGRSFLCSPAALIPRAETELLARTALDHAAPGDTIVDIGTGSGNLAITLALDAEAARVYACDISEPAIGLTRANVERHGVHDRVFPRTGDLFDALEGLDLDEQVDLVVCNPPYIPSGSLEKLPPDVRESEPLEAFDGGAFGLEIFRRLVREAPRYLRPGGNLAFEIGVGQERLVERVIRGVTAYEPAVEYRDDDGRVRVFRLTRRGD